MWDHLVISAIDGLIYCHMKGLKAADLLYNFYIYLQYLLPQFNPLSKNVFFVWYSLSTTPWSQSLTIAHNTASVRAYKMKSTTILHQLYRYKKPNVQGHKIKIVIWENLDISTFIYHNACEFCARAYKFLYIIDKYRRSPWCLGDVKLHQTTKIWRNGRILCPMLCHLSYLELMREWNRTRGTPLALTLCKSS